MLYSVNPANNETLEQYAEHSSQELQNLINEVHSAFQSYPDVSLSSRSSLLINAANVLRKRKEEFSNLMTLEMGKPIAQSRAEVEKCAWVCEYYADNAESFLKDQIIQTDASKSFIAFRPIGIILAIMPWNFPFWQVFRFAAPNLIAGNCGILKHASNVSGCSLAIESVFREAGFPENVFRSVLVKGLHTAQIIQNPYVRAVTLTGSTPVGKNVASIAGAVLKKSVLELGGSDPYVILDDADIELSAESCVTSRLINAGQSCIAAKRFIVTSKIYDSFTERFTQIMKQKKMGNPFDETNDLGPQARTDLRDELQSQVQESIKKGAIPILGCEIPETPGAWYPPSLVSNVLPGMPAYDEELFGPVAAIIKAKDEEDAIRIANDSPFGLGAAIFTRDLEKGEYIAKYKIHSGSCFVNTIVKSDPRLPFGGINESGYGRELSQFGMYEFLNIKTIYIR